MPETVRITAPAVYQAEGYTVYVRQRWTDSWEELPGLYCNWVSWSAAPTISSAEFERRYGEGMLESEAAFAYHDYLNRGTWWVKVEIEQFDDDRNPLEPLIWIGIIEVDGDNPAGSPNAQPMGAQKYLAYGPEILLERSAITSTYAWATAQMGADIARFYEGIPFNQFLRIHAADRLAKKEFQERPGNRSRAANADGIYPFADPDEGNLDASMAAWEARHIIDYLLFFQGPRDKDGVKTIEFRLLSDEYVPTGVCYEIRQQGVTVREILNQLLDRRRLLSYAVEPDPDVEGKFVVRPFSFLDQAIDLDDLELWENLDQKILIVDKAVLVAGLNVQESWVQFYHRVVAVGAPIVCCGTFSYHSSLRGAWTVAEASAYTAATTSAAGYAGLEAYIRQYNNDTFRKEERFERVFSAFGLSKTTVWSQCGDAYPGGGLEDFFPTTLFGDAEKCTAPFSAIDTGVYLPSLKLAKVLPLRSDHDYSGSKIADDQVADQTIAGANWKYLSPLVVLNRKDPEGAANNFCDISLHGGAVHTEGMDWGPGAELSCSLQIPENSAFFQLKIPDASPRHALAKSDYTAPANLGYDEQGPLYDWKTDLLATLAVETNCRVQVQWPESVADETDSLRTLWLDLSEFAALHYVAPKTVVAVEDGKLIRTTSGGIIRDDRPLLKRMARLAYEWYSRRRQALSLTYTGAKKYFRVGDLIVELGEGATREPIRSVVTQIRVDFGRNPNDAHRTTIETQWAELDVVRLLA